MASRRDLERESGATFKYPNLYEPQPIVNGLDESVVPVITAEESRYIQYAIWGMLPENYRDDWDMFQNILNTLNLSREGLDSNLWYSRAMENRRCLILVSGFFTFYLRNGEIFPYYVQAATGVPLCLGGIYSQLEDGFLTCALVIVNANTFIRKIQNIDRGMPLVVWPEQRKNWLNPAEPRQKVSEFLEKSIELGLKAHPIDKDFYKRKSTSARILNPVVYPGIP